VANGLRSRHAVDMLACMPRVIIAGAGFGGLSTAAALRRQDSVGRLEIVLIDRRRDYVMGLRKSWAALGISSLVEGVRDLAEVEGVTVEVGEITRVDPVARAVHVNGRTLEADALVVAMGARHDPEAVPGLVRHGINVWDRDEIERARIALDGLADRRLVIGIFEMPYSCPPAPYELALLARERFERAVEIVVFSPAPIALPVVGPAESAKLEAMLAAGGITFLPARKAVSVEDRAVRFTDGSIQSFDVLLAIPPHRCPPVLVDAGLAAAGGWVKPDPRTLEMEQPGVYAIGDCTVITLANGLALPKAGIFAEQQGHVVAARIAARLAGDEPQATFAGEAFCYLETGSGKAAIASGAFMADPVAVSISEPTPEALAEKHEFERSRLTSWFGR